MSGADSGGKEHASGSEDPSDVPTQRGGSCCCGHPDEEHDHHIRGGGDRGACRRSRLSGGFGLAELLVAALRRGP